MLQVSEDASSRKIEFNLMRLKDITKAGERKGFYEAGVIVRNTIKANISALPRFGRLERYKGRRRRASVEGESFANRSRDAQATLGFDVRGSNYMEVGFRQNAKTIYTKILEESKNRPTLQIAAKETKGIVQNTLLNEIKNAHEEGFK